MLTKTPTTSEPIQDHRRLLMEQSTVRDWSGWGTSRMLHLIHWFVYEEKLRRGHEEISKFYMMPGDD